MLHHSFLLHLQERFKNFFDSEIEIFDHSTVTGGDINQAFKLNTSKGYFLIKVNAAMFGLDLFEKEARGLILLADANAIKVPRPLFDGKFHQQVFLVMEYLEHGEPAENFWAAFGEGLARLHHNTQDHFGLDYDNYIGRLVQHNVIRPSWPEFYAQQRILWMANKAATKQLLNAEEMQLVEAVVNKFDSILPDEKPHLLHGDLWNGNYLSAVDGGVAIFDPAVYYGNREMDLAMTLLFGGFDKAFYESYQHHYPLQPGWQERVELCQLYPLLVHLVLFGGHYHTNVINILKRYA